ncbi:hypothetical protein, partial [Brevibacterium casei]|uniref:hypothetical protein n=1 Tax=Brevibacterium casei TaxID=33889 RepID=UPI0031593C6B
LLRRVPLPRVRHDETSLPARSSEHQDDSHNDWTYIPGSAHLDLTLVSDSERRYLFDRDFSWSPREPINR